MKVPSPSSWRMHRRAARQFQVAHDSVIVHDHAYLIGLDGQP
jgi:hypothetical protein